MPYDPAMRTMQADAEERMGLVPIEELLAERDDLIRELAPLRARHGSFGTWDDLRRLERSTIAMAIRAKALASSTKVTEAAVEDMAQSDPAYVAFVTQGTLEKAKWHELENRIQGITDTIRRAEVVGRYLTAEVSLTPR